VWQGTTSAYLDLRHPEWRCVEAAGAGWQITDTPPHVRFRRPKGLQELPAPERGGNLLELVPFLNCANVDDLQLIAAWLVAACRPNVRRSGAQWRTGRREKHLARRLRQLTDPNLACRP